MTGPGPEPDAPIAAPAPAPTKRWHRPLLALLPRRRRVAWWIGTVSAGALPPRHAPDTVRVTGAPVTPALALALALALSGCATPSAPVGVRVAGPPAGGVVDYQLGGAYPPAPGVTGVVRDSTDAPAAGLYSVCYVNGFQTQPDDREEWLSDRGDLVLRQDGSPVVDPGWPDELILDTSTAERRSAIVDALAPTLSRCVESGFDAIEIDNLDSYTRSGGALDADDALDLAALFAARAHESGLAIAQKNAADLSARARAEAGFDFAVAEECHRFDECTSYTRVYGDAVVDIEYSDDLRGIFADACADPATPRSTVLRDRALTTPADAGYVFEAC
jgi:hypothetical protein